MQNKVIEQLDLTIIHLDEDRELKSFNSFVESFDIFESKGYLKTITCPKCQNNVDVKIQSLNTRRNYDKLGSVVFLIPIFILYLYSLIQNIIEGNYDGFLTFLRMIIAPIIQSAIIGGIIGLLIYITLVKFHLLKNSGFEIDDRTHISKGGIIEQISK